MSQKNFSKESRKVRDGLYENHDSEFSYDPKNDESIDYDAWAEFISYYRYYIDEFACDILGLKLYPFQRLILRAMARFQHSMFIACRGLGKSYLTAVFFICSAILYPNIKLGIASGNSQQARNVVIQKIKGELVKNENIAREIKFPIKTSSDDCVVEFKNGSEIRAITLAQDRGGDGARSWRFHYILIDEARLVKDYIIEEILIPMTKTKRQAAIYHNKLEKGKSIFITSAYLKTHDIYKRFKFHYDEMIRGSKDYYVCALPYKVGVQANIFEEEDILKELDKPTMTKDKFMYEYEAVFVGSSGDSYYPYELTEKCRKLDKCELEQPKKSQSSYIIVHDVALSDARDSDNACTHVIKLKEKPNGTFFKDVVYTKTHNGLSLPEQKEFLRNLVHRKFPNCIKLVIDMRGNGEPLPSLFYETWEYTDEKTKDVIEYPPLVLDDDEKGKNLKGAIPLIRGITSTVVSNNTMYTYMKSSFEDQSIRLLLSSTEMDEKYKSDEITPEEFSTFGQTDLLIQELSNIKQDMSKAGNIIYDRIVSTKKRDRVTSLAYGLSFVLEMEEFNRRNLLDDDYDFVFTYS
jgi:hypothetical protein